MQVGRVTPRAPGPPFTLEAGLRELFRLPSSDLCSLGQRGRALVAERFTWPKIAANMLAVYHWVLGSGPKPDCVQLT